MQLRTPITLITGPLGSGKTTLLRHILATRPTKIAIVMNEFGEIAIDTKVIEGKNVRIAELGGGCVCCSLLGEFEAAVNEIIARVGPDIIIVETTGLAEPEALVFNIQEALPQCRLDGVQIEGADILLLNKIDLVQPQQIEPLEAKLRELNRTATIVRTERCWIDPDLLFGIGHEKKVAPPQHKHQPEFESFTFTSEKDFSRNCFEGFVDSLPANVHRAKGFVRFSDGAQLFNFVSGRWDLEPFESAETQLIFIGKEIATQKSAVIEALKRCEL